MSTRTPKFTVNEIVIFKGQDYSTNQRAIVTRATYDADIAACIYDVYVIADKEKACNCYEDMLVKGEF